MKNEGNGLQVCSSICCCFCIYDDFNLGSILDIMVNNTFLWCFFYQYVDLKKMSGFFVFIEENIMPYTHRHCGMLSVGIDIAFQHNTSSENLNLSIIGWFSR